MSKDSLIIIIAIDIYNLYTAGVGEIKAIFILFFAQLRLRFDFDVYFTVTNVQVVDVEFDYRHEPGWDFFLFISGVGTVSATANYKLNLQRRQQGM